MDQAQPELTIAVAATFTAEPLAEPLAYWMGELGLPARVRLLAGGQVFQALLDSAGPFLTNECGLNVLLVKPDDWLPDRGANRADSPEEAVELARTVRDFAAALVAAALRSRVPYLVILCPVAPPARGSGHPEGPASPEAAVWSGLPEMDGVYYVSSSQLLAAYPVGQCFDALLEREAHIPYTSAFYAALATMIARRLFVLREPPPKAIVLDCDQTLWGGVCGEDALRDLSVAGPFRFLQEFMVAQRRAGMLLCICSRNNEADVRHVFERHPGMVLRADDIAAWRVNWSRKSENLRSLAAELNLAPASLILVDDNPIECAEIVAALPQVLTLQLPPDPQDIPGFLRHVWVFDHVRATPEDRCRTEFYARNAARAQLARETPTLRDFLAGLHLDIQMAPMAQEDIPRVAQLTCRTNQFNTTGVRRTEAEVRRLTATGELECLVVRVSDRFGDYGLVGVVMGAATTSVLSVDTFLLSCRVLGRGVEHAILRHLGHLAEQRHLGHVDIRFRPTGRNQPALDFLEGLPFGSALPAGPEITFRFPAQSAAGAALDLSVPEAPPALRRPDTSPPPAAPRAGKSQLLCRIAGELADIGRILVDMESKRRHPGRMEGTDFAPPRTPTERSLCRIWAGLLGTEVIGVHHNFFEVGGHSLLATQVLSRVYETFHVELSIQDIFEAPTIAALAAVVETRQIERAAAPQVLALLREMEGLTDDQIETLLAREGAPP
jgi:FkbH-like protein